MKCPMLTMYSTTFGTPGDYKDRDCLKEECAVWDVWNQQCPVLSIKGYLRDIAMALEHIADKMPHEGQFRK